MCLSLCSFLAPGFIYLINYLSGMIEIVNSFIPFTGYMCMTVLCFMFIRWEWAPRVNAKVRNHEHIHAFQQMTLLVLSIVVCAILIPVFHASWWWMLISIPAPLLWYVLFWLIEVLLPPYPSAYRDSCFEREAYANEDNLDYLKGWPVFGFLRYFLRGRDRVK